MNIYRTVALFFILSGCSNSPTAEDLDYLNGYWEIKGVVFPDGTKKDYNVNTNVDFIQLETREGFRKKVQPKLNGTYDTSNDAQPFVISEKEGTFLIHYQNGTNTWSEVLVKLSENGFSVRNEEGLTYTYERFDPINIAK